MTATAEFIKDRAPVIEPVRVADGARMIVRGIQRLLGVSLTLAALAIWLMPGASWESDLMLFKLILSLTAVIAGLGLVGASAAPKAPEIEIDTIRREVRVVRRLRGAPADVLQTCSFGDLSRAEHVGNIVRLWDAAGTLLAEASLTDRETLSSLLAGLRDAGKLA